MIAFPNLSPKLPINILSPYILIICCRIPGNCIGISPFFFHLTIELLRQSYSNNYIVKKIDNKFIVKIDSIYTTCYKLIVYIITNPKPLTYSDRNALTGLAIAALTACQLTVNKVIPNANPNV